MIIVHLLRVMVLVVVFFVFAGLPEFIFDHAMIEYSSRLLSCSALLSLLAGPITF